MSRYPSRFHFFIRHLQQVLARPVLREIADYLDWRSLEQDDGSRYGDGRGSAFQDTRDIVRSYISGVRIQPEISKREVRENKS